MYVDVETQLIAIVLYDVAVEGTCGEDMAVFIGGICGKLYELGMSIHIAEVGACKIFTAGYCIVGSLIESILQSLTEVLIHQSDMGIDLLIFGLGRSDCAAAESEGGTIQMETAEIGGGSGIGDIGVEVEETVCLCPVKGTGGCAESDTCVNAPDNIIIVCIGVLVVVVDPLDGVELNGIGIPVVLILYEIDLGILLELPDKEGSAVNLGRDILGFTESIGIGISRCFCILLYAEYTAAGLIEALADGKEAGVGEHGEEVGGGLLEVTTRVYLSAAL